MPRTTEDYKPNRRDFFAAAALTGIISNADTMRELTQAYDNIKSNPRIDFMDMIAVLAFQYADAIIQGTEEEKERHPPHSNVQEKLIEEIEKEL